MPTASAHSSQSSKTSQPSIPWIPRQSEATGSIPSQRGYGRQSIRQSTRISNPGCYATSSQLLLGPLVKNKLIKPGVWPTVFGVSGYSGAGTVAGAAAGVHSRAEVDAAAAAAAGLKASPHGIGIGAGTGVVAGVRSPARRNSTP